jgi:HTH-type transcriptional regulator/antitoxin HigA
MFDLSKGEYDFYFIFANLIADRIEEYETKYLEHPTITGREMLAFLIKERRIKQCNLASITAQGNISAILNGSRAINLDHAKGFAKFFGVPITVFIK